MSTQTQPQETPSHTRSKTPPPPAPDPDWLPVDPPPLLARATAWVILAFFTATFLASAVIRLPEHVRCPFRLVPDGPSDPVQTPVAGVLRSVAIEPGQTVEPGTVLFEVQSDELLAWETDLRFADEELGATRERTTRLEEAHRKLLELKETESRQVEQERRFRQQHRETVALVLEGMRELHRAKVASSNELQRAILDLAAADKDLAISGQSLQRIALEKARLETERTRERGDEQATVRKLENQASTLRKRLEGSEHGVLRIRSPQRAVVLDVPSRSPGSVLTRGQELCQLAPVSDHPVVELELSQSGLDRVAAGQPMRLFFDAFPYQRYGALESKVAWLSPTTVRVPGGSVFRARAALGHATFESAGRQLPARVGMVGEARIRVGERTILESVFEPLKALRERAR